MKSVNNSHLSLKTHLRLHWPQVSGSCIVFHLLNTYSTCSQTMLYSFGISIWLKCLQPGTMYLGSSALIVSFKTLFINCLKRNHVLSQVHSDGICYVVPPPTFVLIRTAFGKCLRKWCLICRASCYLTAAAQRFTWRLRRTHSLAFLIFHMFWFEVICKDCLFTTPCNHCCPT